MIRAIFFDLDGTLIDMRAAWLGCFAEYMARHAPRLGPEKAEELGKLWDMLGGHPMHNHRDYSAWIARAAPGLGLSRERISAELVEGLLRRIVPDPEVLSLIADLPGRYRTAIITNGSVRLQRAKLRRAGLAGAVGRVFISGEVRLRKPDPALFRLALDWAGVEPGEALMVGDLYHEDIDGAHETGLRTCYVGPLSPRDGGIPDFHLDRVTDLPGVLG